MNLGETFNKFQKSIQESSGFSFSKFLADDPIKGELIVCLYEAGSESYQGKGHLPKILQVYISDFKHSTGLSVIYHDQMDIWEQASTKNFEIIFLLMNILSRAGQSLGWPSQQATESRQSN